MIYTILDSSLNLSQCVPTEASTQMAVHHFVGFEPKCQLGFGQTLQM
jgi:hypothetical protein